MWLSRITVILSITFSLIVGGYPASAKDEIYLFDLLKKKPQILKGWRLLLPKQYHGIKWVYDLSGVQGPVGFWNINGRLFYKGMICEPHNCNGSQLVYFVSEDGANAYVVWDYNGQRIQFGERNKMNGQGTATLNNGDKYVGEFKDFKRSGLLTVSYAIGDAFSGNYTSDKRQGQGTYIWKDGSKYVGQWADGVPTEDGLHTAASGTVLRDVKYTNAATYYGDSSLKSADVLTYEAPAVVAQQTVQQTEQVVQPISPTDADTGKRVALVIGNGKYVNSGYLPNPSNDARSIARALAEIGFDVSKGEDLDRAGMEQLLREFLRKAASSKVALFFFAGHGMQVNGKNYLIPVDAKLEAASDLNFGTVELDKILASLEDPTRATIIILDACRDNPLARTFASTSRSGAVGNGLAGYSALGSGTLIAFSTAPGQVALDGEGSSNSPFTQGLVKHLGTPGLEVRQMLTRVRADVAAATQDKQIPWDNSSLRGDVYLTGSPPESNVITQTQPSQPASDPAAQAWGIIQNTTSVAVLEDFVRQFSTTVYGSLAKARLEEVKKSQISNMESKSFGYSKELKGGPRELNGLFVSNRSWCGKGIFELDSLGIYSDFMKEEDKTFWASCTGNACGSVIVAHEITYYGYLLKLAGGFTSKAIKIDNETFDFPGLTIGKGKPPLRVFKCK